MSRLRIPAAGLLALAACEPRVTSLGAWVHAKPDAAVAHGAESADAAVAHDGQYLEAEQGVLNAGFTPKDDASASGGRCIVPPAAATSEEAPGAARALYRFQVARSASYVIWGRIHSPGVDHNRFWFRVDGSEFRKWRISTGDIWYWDALHEDLKYDTALSFELTKGEHELEFANCVDGVELDRLYVTADGDMPPGNDTACNPPHSIQLGDACEPSCGSHGKTTCIAADCEGRETLPAYDCAVCCKVAP
jgi:hypothetical protein